MACVAPHPDEDVGSAVSSVHKAKGGNDKVTICHIPPGNPSNAHTISVGASAVKAHLDHGDNMGDCEARDDGDDGDDDDRTRANHDHLV
jgi:hypothetical protein